MAGKRVWKSENYYEEAMKREAAIKRLSAAKKRELIAGRRVKCCTGTEKTGPDREKVTEYKK